MTGMAYQNGMVASIGDTNLIRIFNVSRKTLLLVIIYCTYMLNSNNIRWIESFDGGNACMEFGIEIS